MKEVVLHSHASTGQDSSFEIYPCGLQQDSAFEIMLTSAAGDLSSTSYTLILQRPTFGFIPTIVTYSFWAGAASQDCRSFCKSLLQALFDSVGHGDFYPSSIGYSIFFARGGAQHHNLIHRRGHLARLPASLAYPERN